MSDTNIIRNLIATSSTPVLLKEFNRNNGLCEWTVEKWSKIFTHREIPFRTMRKDYISDEPCWERKCELKTMTFDNFLKQLSNNQYWMYFDYKYMHQWFTSEDELFKEVSWKQFGYPDKGVTDTTLWIGSEGAHTPLHQDTYGSNIVTQIYGKKRWILFPPETGGLKPTRVPYEESSVYSELNFYCPSNLDRFKGLTGARSVELCAGDALIVPRGWWHYVQNLDSLNISMNMWLPHEKDGAIHVSEAIIRILVAQICKDLPQETSKLVVNPNEDDLADTPLAVLFLQLETVAKAYLDKRRKQRRVKRQKTEEGDSSELTKEFDPNCVINKAQNNIVYVPSISHEDLVGILRGNLSKYASKKKNLEEDETDCGPASLCLTKAVIDSFSEPNVIDLVKQNLFARLDR